MKPYPWNKFSNLPYYVPVTLLQHTHTHTHKEVPGYPICAGVAGDRVGPKEGKDLVWKCEQRGSRVEQETFDRITRPRKLRANFSCCSDFSYHLYAEEFSDLYLWHSISHKLTTLYLHLSIPHGTKNIKNHIIHLPISNLLLLVVVVFHHLGGPTVYLVIKARNLLPFFPTPAIPQIQSEILRNCAIQIFWGSIISLHQ